MIKPRIAILALVVATLGLACGGQTPPASQPTPTPEASQPEVFSDDFESGKPEGWTDVQPTVTPDEAPQTDDQ